MKKILAIPGDGIGKEVMYEAYLLIENINKKFNTKIEITHADWGADKWLNEGIGLPKNALDTIPKEFDAILFGALGDKRIPDMAHGREILLGLRFGLDLYINLRPIKLLNQNLSPLKEKKNLDFVIFRENTEDIYLGAGGSIHGKTIHETAIDESIHTYHGVKRIIIAAFEYANKNNRNKVTLIDKSNAIKFSGNLWQRVFAEVSQKYPNVITEHQYVDAAAMKMVLSPESFDVIVTSNLFGDILSDIGAGLIGGLGLAASANINPNGIGLFEPVHGSAPDIAGKNIANPCGMFLSVALMMDFLGFKNIANSIEKAVSQFLLCNNTTKDLGGSLLCNEASKEVRNFFNIAAE